MLFVIIVIISFLLLRLAASEGGANVFKVSYFKGKCTELKTTHTPAYALMVVFRGVGLESRDSKVLRHLTWLATQTDDFLT